MDGGVKLAIIIIALIVLLVGVFIAFSGPKCPDDAERSIIYNGHCYALYLPKDGIDWYDASKSCKEKGMYLVTITSKGEWDALVNDLSVPVPYCLWIGYTDENRRMNDFAWITGEKGNFEFWDENQPDNYENREDCALIYDTYTSREGKWNDYVCSDKKFLGKTPIGYICESS